MEITIGRNPPGSVTVDLRRADALAQIAEHVRMVRSRTEARSRQTEATPPVARTPADRDVGQQTRPVPAAKSDPAPAPAAPAADQGAVSSSIDVLA